MSREENIKVLESLGKAVRDAVYALKIVDDYHQQCEKLRRQIKELTNEIKVLRKTARNFANVKRELENHYGLAVCPICDGECEGMTCDEYGNCDHWICSKCGGTGVIILEIRDEVQGRERKDYSED